METLYDKHKSKLNNWTFLVRNPALPTEILEEIITSPKMGNEEWNPNDTAWQNIMAHPSFTMKLIDKYMDDGIYDGEKYFKYLSMNPNLSPAFIDKYKTQLDWKWLSQNPALTTDLMEKHISRLKLDTLLDNPNLTFDFIYKNKLDRKIDWEGFAWHPNFSIDNFKLVMSHGDLYDLDRGEMWSHFSINPNITAEFIEDKCFMHPKDETCTHSFHLDWNVLSANKSLSPEFIRENIGHFIEDYVKEENSIPINYTHPLMNQNEFDWGDILKNPSTPSDLLDEIADSVNKYENDRVDVRIKDFWNWASQSANLTPEFIENYKRKLNVINWQKITLNKNLSPQFWHELLENRSLKGKMDAPINYNRLAENPVIFKRFSKYNPYERMVRKRMGLTYEAEAPSYCNRCYDGDLTPMTVYDDYDDKEYIYYSCNRCNYVSKPTVVEDERLKGNTCYMCDKDALFIYEDLPTGAKPFCSEKCMCQYGGMPYYGEGYYGLGIEGTEDAQTKMLLKRRGILKAENNEKQKVFVRQLLDGEPNYFGDLAWSGEYKGFKFEIDKPSPAKERKQKKLYDWYKGEGYKIWLMLDDTLKSNVELILRDDERGFQRYQIDIRYLGKDKYGKIKTMPQVKKIIRNFVDSMLDGTLNCGHEGCDKPLSAKDFYWCVGCSTQGNGDMFYCNEHYYTYSKEAKHEKQPSIKTGCKYHLKSYYEGKDFDEEKHIERFLNPNVIRIKRMREKRQFGNEEIRPQSRTIEYVGLGAVSVLLILALFKRR